MRSRDPRVWRNLPVVIYFLFVLIGLIPEAIGVDDAYIAGYAAAVLEHEFHLAGASLEVHEGVITVSAPSLGAVDRQKIIAALESIPGAVRAQVQETPQSEGPKTNPPVVIPRSVPSSDVDGGIQQDIPKAESKILPRGLLFNPLHADPRWPHFSSAYRQTTQGPEGKETFSANFGETFALYRHPGPFDGQWEIGIQAGVFSLFNVGAASGSKDLINADYIVGLLTSYRKGDWSGFIRLHHQSSHLGDEFILNSQTPVNRLNLSFEEIDIKVSYDLMEWIRVYGGAGYIVGRDPKDLKRGASQYGVELTSPWTFAGGRIRPVAYADFQANARSNWEVGRSILAGLQFENARIGDRKFQILLEYYSGISPNGQFFIDKTEWFGAGIHLYF